MTVPLLLRKNCIGVGKEKPFSTRRYHRVRECSEDILGVVFLSRIKVRLTAPPFGRLPTADIARQRRARMIYTPLRAILRDYARLSAIAVSDTSYLIGVVNRKIASQSGLQ